MIDSFQRRTLNVASSHSNSSLQSDAKRCAVIPVLSEGFYERGDTQLSIDALSQYLELVLGEYSEDGTRRAGNAALHQHARKVTRGRAHLDRTTNTPAPSLMRSVAPPPTLCSKRSSDSYGAYVGTCCGSVVRTDACTRCTKLSRSNPLRVYLQANRTFHNQLNFCTSTVSQA